MRIVFYLSILILLVALSLWLTDWLFLPRGFNFIKYSLRSVLLLISVLLFWKIFLSIAKENDNRLFKNIITFFGMLYSLLMVLEIIFSFLPLSCSGDNVLVAKNWFNYNWVENQLGYRDKDPFKIDRNDKKNIFVIGDSFVAGHGLNEEEERFSNILRKQFGFCADVFNLGIRGADTQNEFDFLASFPVKPDLIILSHVNNDIYTVLDRKNIMEVLDLPITLKSHIKRFKPSKNYILRNSFFLNFIDYLIVEQNKKEHFASLVKNYSDMQKFLDSEDGKAIEMTYYKNDSLMQLQLKRIDAFVNYSKENNVPLLVILFPKVNDAVIDYTDKTANQPIALYLEEKDVSVINLTKKLKQIPEEKRSVSNFDSHPSIYANIVVADTITKYITKNAILENISIKGL